MCSVVSRHFVKTLKMEGSSSDKNRKNYPIRNRIKTDAVNNIRNWLQDDEKDILYSESGSEEEFSENEEDEGEECCGVQLDVENTPTGETALIMVMKLTMTFCWMIYWQGIRGKGVVHQLQKQRNLANNNNNNIKMLLLMNGKKWLVMTI